MFFNRTIKRYSAFEGFYGMEDTIERIVGYFKHAAQGLEEKRQILYLLGPVGGGKSSLAERLKDLMEKHPIYVLKAGEEISPVFESPLGLFRSAELGIPAGRALRHRTPPTDRRHEPVGRQTPRRSSAATSRNSKSRASIRPSCASLRSPRPNPATRTTRTFPRSSARSTSASSSISARTIPTPIPSRAACAAPIRACSNSSRCSRRRSRFCTRC